MNANPQLGQPLRPYDERRYTALDTLLLIWLIIKVVEGSILPRRGIFKNGYMQIISEPINLTHPWKRRRIPPWFAWLTDW